jgi:type 1 glutamine amidotransferase
VVPGPGGEALNALEPEDGMQRGRNHAQHAGLLALILGACSSSGGSQGAPPAGSLDAQGNGTGSGGSAAIDGGAPLAPEAGATGAGGENAVPSDDAAGVDAGTDPALDAALPGDEAEAPAEGGTSGAIFLFTRTTGFRHPSIEPAAAALTEALTPLGLSVETGADPKTFTTAGLSRFRGIVLISTTGKPLGDPGTDALDALLAFVRAGGALIGIHGASSTEYDPALPYTPLIGGKFVDHPGSVRTGTCHPASQHPSAARLPATLTVHDEIYFMDHLRPDNEVDLTCDALTGGALLPIAWHRAEGSGRVFYTALGHGPEQYAASNPVFKDHIIPGILWALGR